MHDLPSLVGPEPPADAPRVLSVCSGVGGKDLGFHRAGFRTVGLCEWDPWRRAVLGRHWPGVPIHPDLAELAAWAERDPHAVREWLGGQPDVLIGGTPCQDLSHAGKRAGIDGERSGLFFAFIRLRNALDVEWTVWENVAGALSSNSGLDFMAVVGAFVGAPVAVPGDGVGGAGVAAGPWGGCVWRLLNAQHFGVPQRRRRVFVVGRLGGPCPPEVLIEPDGGGGHPAPRGAARPVPAWAAAARAGAAGRSGLAGDDGRGAGGGAGGGADGALGQPIAGPLGAGSGGGWRNDLDSHGAYVDTASALTGGGQSPDGYDDNAAAAGFIVSPTVTTSPGFAAGCGHDGGDEASIAVAAALTEADRLSHSREDGRAAGRRARPDADEVGEPGGEHERRAAEADADGVRAPDGMAGRVDGAAVSGRVRATSVRESAGVHPALTESDVAAPLSAGGGGIPGQGYPLARVEPLVGFDGATHSLTAEGHDASEDGTGRGTPIAWTDLSNGAAENDLSPTVRGGGGNTMPNVAPTLRGSTGHGGGGHKDGEDLAIADALVRGELPPGADRCAHDPPPDGRRYAACGDGVAAPHSHWLGLRLRPYVTGEAPS